jgi:hypothetical protein
MRLAATVATALGAAMICAGAAAAQTLTAEIPGADLATRMQLAKQLYDLSGGAAAANAQVRMMLATASRLANASVPPDQARLTSAMMRDMQDELLGLTPSMIDAGVQAYADTLTTPELQDYVAWLSSPSGRAVVQKSPAIRQAILDREMPAMAAMIPQLQHRIVDHVCEEVHCTAKERETVAAAMAHAFPTQAG